MANVLLHHSAEHNVLNVLNVPKSYWSRFISNAHVADGLQRLCGSILPNTDLVTFLYGYGVEGPSDDTWNQLFEACDKAGLRSPDYIAGLIAFWRYHASRVANEEMDSDRNSPLSWNRIPWQNFVESTLRPVLFGLAKESTCPGIIAVTKRNWLSWQYGHESLRQRVLNSVETAVSAWSVYANAPTSLNDAGERGSVPMQLSPPQSYVWCHADDNDDNRSDGGFSAVSMCSSRSVDCIPNYYFGQESTCGAAVQAIARRVASEVIARWRPGLVQVFDADVVTELEDSVYSRAMQLLFDKMWACATSPRSFEDESPLSTN